MNQFFLVDAHAFLYRNYFALPKFTTSRGEEVGALYGFIKLIFKIKSKTDYLAVCYDSHKNFRKDILPSYKANRKKMDDALKKQVDFSKEVLKNIGVKIIEKEGFEADDLIATLSKKIVQSGFEVIIVSGDKDLLQIINDRVKLWDGKSDEFFAAEYVREKYGVDPDKLLSYFSLIGDPSDNIEGVEGIGPKTAVHLIKKYGNVDLIINSTDNDKIVSKIKTFKDKIDLNIKLLKLNDNVDIDFNIDEFKLSEFSKDGIIELVKRFEFSNIEISDDEMKDTKKMKMVLKDEFLDIKKDYVCISTKFISYNDFYIPFDKEIARDVLLSRIWKYLYNFKSLLHIINIDLPHNINNFDDIYIAYHLVYGGVRKPDIDRIIREKFFVRPEVDSGYFKDIMDELKKKISDYAMMDLYKNELSLSTVLYYIERNGIRVDTSRLYSLLKDFDVMINKTEKKFRDIAQLDINLNSPRQLSDFIFKKLNLKLDEKYENIYKTKTGGYSTSEDVLKMLMPYNPEVIGLILSYREYIKLKSVVESLLKSVKDSRIHTTFDQTATHTGRISSSNPNLQNIPREGEDARKIRECFIPEDGFLFVSFDYSQIDLRVLAHLSGDEVLSQAFINNEDIHIKTASSIFGVEKSMVSRELRKIAKAVNFGIIYGQTPMGLSIETGIKYEEAKKYIENYFNEYKGVKKWIEDTINAAYKQGYVSNFLNRRRTLTDITSPNKKMRSMAERMAINMPVQSGSSDIIKKAMNMIYDLIKGKDDIRLVLQIHDELLFEIKNESVEKYKDKIKKIMEDCVVLKVPLKVDVKMGKNWACL